MEKNLWDFKKIGIVIIVLLLIMVGFFIFANANRTYSASDILGDYADLNSENPFVDIESIDHETENIFTSIEIPEETQQELIEAFKNAKFKKASDVSSDYDYRINITLNTGYAMFVDSDKKSLIILDTYENYTMENDSDFFQILKNATK
ncbi:hypothetical protein AN959_16265 [Psychrobacillus sp. FJAT-21963]|nr:hypothetical protein AN959_16265 [Psychrobacillus sp. FJAT-21963]